MSVKSIEEQKKAISDITKKHLEGKTLEGFGKALGINASKQSVHQWKNGDRIPEALTLFQVVGSPESEPWAKIWAAECLSAIQQGQTTEPKANN